MTVRTLSEESEPAGRTMAFPGLDGADEQRMEDVLAARLFPQRVTPRRIGRYAIVDRIGQGGMSVVYAAHDEELDRRVAIKVLTESLAGRAEARLLREAQAMARVVHANVVAVIEAGVHEGRAYIVMEYVHGISLERWRERDPTWRDTLRVYVQAGRGLAAAHRAGVIHRDFKPHNAMLAQGGVDDGRVKVLDFGLARAALAEPEATPTPGDAGPGSALALPLTRTGAVMGTPAYMAPEQLAGQPASERSDQFSFAVALYEALYGQLPFAGETMSALTLAVLAGVVRPPPAGAQVPAWVHRVLLRGLALAPVDRFPAMTELCDALERDPGARRRTAAVTLAFGAALGVGGWGLARLGVAEAPATCVGPEFALEDVWNETRAAALAASFAATRLPYADDAARRVRARLDEYAEAWSAMRQDACEAHGRGAQSAALLDLRMACLDRRRAGLAALAGVFVEADAATVERAVEAALALPGLEGCADAAALTAETRLPDDPATAGAVEEARKRLAEVGALVAAGRLEPATRAGEAVMAEARDLGFGALVAEAALALGAIRLEQGRGAEADPMLSIAVHEGLAGRADRVVAEALARRLYVRGLLLAEDVRAADDEALAEGYTARFADDGALLWLVDQNRGALAYRRGDGVRARELYTRALTVTDGVTALEQARTRVNLGLVAFDARDFGAALAWYREAAAQVAGPLGEQHPLVAQVAMYEGLALFELGRFEAARGRLTEVLERLVAVGAEGSPHGVWTRIYLARLAARAGAYAEAREHATRAAGFATEPLAARTVEVCQADATVEADLAFTRYADALTRTEATFGADGLVTAGLLRWIGAGMLRTGRAQQAMTVARRWLAIGEAEPDAASTALPRRFLAEVALELGRVDEAVAAASAAVATLDRLPGERPVDVVQARQVLGRALIAAGRADEAVAVLAAAEGAAQGIDARAPERVALASTLERARREAGSPR